MKTKMLKMNDVDRKWYLVDVKDKVLGRAATGIATLLSGKYRPDFTPHVDAGSGVIVLNCDKVRVTGNKAKQKQYKRYSGYPSGQRETSYEEMHEKDPKYILWHAVRGMLPKNKLSAHMLRRLKMYTGEEHPHAAQQPEVKEL